MNSCGFAAYARSTPSFTYSPVLTSFFETLYNATLDNTNEITINISVLYIYHTGSVHWDISVETVV